MPFTFNAWNITWKILWPCRCFFPNKNSLPTSTQIQPCFFPPLYFGYCVFLQLFFAGNQRFTNPSSCSNFLFDVRTTIVPIATKIGNPLGLTGIHMTCTCHCNIFVLNTSNLGNYSKYWFTKYDSPFFLVRKTSHFCLMWEDLFSKVPGVSTFTTGQIMYGQLGSWSALCPFNWWTY